MSIAYKQNRDFCFILFAGGAGEIKNLTMENHNSCYVKVATEFMADGTNFASSLSKAVSISI
ncbi:hypothetical protein [Bacillus norwichensis]|uniref:Uncharacterized protein n=1 Tax=Bacillus norwichensis TaxID=2762217 RepID=A0ABR8VR56_9BACI|nr:hypothetical protein [Bacillus norwichensis]MBD8007253.1 hypothetical protein [Bacillus norwichensis]